MGDTFTPEARAELLAMYTGMALQGLLAGAQHAGLGVDGIGAEAVRTANATVSALERFYVGRPQ